MVVEVAALIILGAVIGAVAMNISCHHRMVLTKDRERALSSRIAGQDRIIAELRRQLLSHGINWQPVDRPSIDANITTSDDRNVRIELVSPDGEPN